MLSLCIVLFAILFLSAAFSFWFADTALPTPLRNIYSIVSALTITSVLYDVILVLSFPFHVCTAASLFIAACLILYIQRRPQSSFLQHISGTSLSRTTIYSVIALALICSLSYMFIPHSGRWGRWDAKAIWTLHALFLSDPHHWASMFSPDIAWTHADYPLLLPSVTAMFWRALGISEPLTPCIIAYLVFAAVLVITYTSFKNARRPFLGILALFIFISSTPYARAAAYQCADTPLSLFILMALVLSRINEHTPNIKLTIFTGLIVGFSGWIKNEGIAFILVFSLFFIWRNRADIKTISHYITGLLLPLAVIFTFKVSFAPANDIMHGQGISTLSKLSDLSRYKLTARFFWTGFSQFYPAFLILGALLSIRSYRRLVDYQLLTLLTMVVVYYFIFIITPRDLQWHLETASERLFMQLFPAFIYVLLYLLGENFRSLSDIRRDT